MSHSSVVSLSKALLSLRWETTLSRRSTLTSHDSNAFELVVVVVLSPCRAQVCTANRSTGGVAGGGEAVRPGSDTAHLQMEMKYQKQSISRSWTVSRQRIQRCFLGGDRWPTLSRFDVHRWKLLLLHLRNKTTTCLSIWWSKPGPPRWKMRTLNLRLKF